jgi:uncharacterized membrane protein
LLGVVTAPNSSSQQQPCSPSKLKLPVMASTGRPSWSGGPQKQQQQLQHQHHITLPQQHQQLTIAPANGATPDDWREQQHMTTHDHAVAAADADSTSSKGKSSGGGKSKGNQSSVWAMAYYKHKTAHGTGLPVAPMQLLAAAAPSLPWSSTSNSSSPHGSSSHLAGASTANGSAKDSGSSSSSSWDSQAKASKEKPGRPAVRVARLLQEPARHRNSCIRQLSVRWSAAMSSPKAAPAMVLTAAFLYSITASLDKVGIEAAQYSLSAYFLAQRVLMGVVGLVYLLTCARGALRHVVRDSLLLFSISLVEQGSVVVYLLAIENILVSYVVAIKRVNVLLSTLIGCVLFKVRQCSCGDEAAEACTEIAAETQGAAPSSSSWQCSVSWALLSSLSLTAASSCFVRTCANPSVLLLLLVWPCRSKWASASPTSCSCCAACCS